MNKPCRNYNKKFFGARYLSEVPGGCFYMAPILHGENLYRGRGVVRFVITGGQTKTISDLKK